MAVAPVEKTVGASLTGFQRSSCVVQVDWGLSLEGLEKIFWDGGVKTVKQVSTMAKWCKGKNIRKARMK